MKVNSFRTVSTYSSIVMFLVVLLSSGIANANMSKTINVLMVGGGSSHDFDRWYKEADVKTLEENGFAKVTYIDDVTEILNHLQTADVLFLSNNQPIEDAGTRTAIFDFVKAGKGLILAHAALWYNWSDWPAYNQKLVSGGSNGHDSYGSFEVALSNVKHPVMKGVDQNFELKDELYYYKVDSTGPGIEVLAMANKAGSDISYPSIFVVKNPKARIVGIALGHDAESHDIANYQTILRNAVKWVARK